MNKRPHSAALDNTNVSSAKKSRIFEDTPTMTSASHVSRFRRRFWTSQISSWQSISSAHSQSSSLALREKRLQPVPSPVNIFSVPPRLSGAMPIASVGRASLLATYRRSIAGASSETKRILSDLEQAGGVATPATNRSRLWFKSIPEETTSITSDRNLGTLPPPTTNLRITEKAQTLALPAVPSCATVSCRPRDHDSTPPIPAPVKRIPTCETTTDGDYPCRRDSVDERNETRPLPSRIAYSSKSKFIFSRPLPVSKPGVSEETVSRDGSHLDALPSAQVVTLSSVALGSSSVNVVSVSSLPSISEASGSSETQVNVVGTRDTSSAPSWSCTTCFIVNSGEKAKCVACQTSKPGTVIKPVRIGTAAFSPSSNVVGEAKGLFSFGQHRSDESTASVLFGQKSSVDNLLPVLSSEQQTSVSEPSTSLLFGQRKPEKSSTIPSKNQQSTNDDTIIPVSSEQQNGVVPKTPTLLVSSAQVAPSSNAAVGSSANVASANSLPPVSEASQSSETSVNILGTRDTSNKTSWSCTTCFVVNSADKVKCIACQSSKPGSVFKPVRIGAAVFSSTSSNVVEEVKGNGDRLLPAVSSNLQNDALTKPTQSFVFGQQKRDNFATVVSFGHHSSGDGLVPAMSLETTVVSTSTTPFLFGQQKSDGNVTAVSSNSGNCTTVFGQQTSDDNAASVVSDWPKTTISSKPTTSFSFGQPKASDSVSSTFTFGQKRDADDAPAVFAFGQAKAGEASQVSTFGTLGKPNGSATSISGLEKTNGGIGKTSSAGGFVFGRSSTTPANLFSIAPQTAPLSSLVPAVSFGQRSTAGGLVPSVSLEKPIVSTATTSFLFGQQRSDSNVTPLSFGQQTSGGNAISVVSSDGPKMPSSKSTTSFSFGQPNVSESVPSAFTFGQQKRDADNAPPVFSFGQAKTGETSQISSFGTLGKPNGSATSISGLGKTNGGIAITSSAGGFGFGQSTVTPTNLFNIAPSTQTAPLGGFVFEPKAPESSNPFSVTSTPTATAIAGRRQLVAKRKVRRP